MPCNRPSAWAPSINIAYVIIKHQKRIVNEINSCVKVISCRWAPLKRNARRCSRDLPQNCSCVCSVYGICVLLLLRRRTDPDDIRPATNISVSVYIVNLKSYVLFGCCCCWLWSARATLRNKSVSFGQVNAWPVCAPVNEYFLRMWMSCVSSVNVDAINLFVCTKVIKTIIIYYTPSARQQQQAFAEATAIILNWTTFNLSSTPRHWCPIVIRHWTQQNTYRCVNWIPLQSVEPVRSKHHSDWAVGGCLLCAFVVCHTQALMISDAGIEHERKKRKCSAQSSVYA